MRQLQKSLQAQTPRVSEKLLEDEFPKSPVLSDSTPDVCLENTSAGKRSDLLELHEASEITLDLVDLSPINQ